MDFREFACITWTNRDTVSGEVKFYNADYINDYFKYYQNSVKSYSEQHDRKIHDIHNEFIGNYNECLFEASKDIATYRIICKDYDNESKNIDMALSVIDLRIEILQLKEKINITKNDRGIFSVMIDAMGISELAILQTELAAKNAQMDSYRQEITQP